MKKLISEKLPYAEYHYPYAEKINPLLFWKGTLALITLTPFSTLYIGKSASALRSIRLSCGIEVRTVIEFPFLYKNSASSCNIFEIARISGGYGSVTNKIFKLPSRKMFQRDTFSCYEGVITL